MPANPDSYRELLLSRLQAVEELLDNADAARPVALDQQSVGRVSRIDAIQQQQMAVANREQADQMARQLTAALRRLEEGSYGDCLECGEPIAEARLQAQPWASLCIDCQSEREAN